MGNNVATGHALTATGLAQGGPAFQKALQLAMRQGGIEPWDPKAQFGDRLERQRALGRKSPFRYLNVRDGLAFYAAHVGGWVTVLTRERFVELSIEYFKSRCMHISTEDAKLFYDVFDSIDLYGDAKLSPGELASGLCSFFAGDSSDHTEAVCRTFSSGGNGSLSRAALKDLVQPYVWAMVPDHAELLRPMFAQFVADELWAEISFHPNKNYIEVQELTKWVRHNTVGVREKLAVYAPLPDVEAPLYASAIVDRVAATMHAAIFVAYREYQDKMQLREYGTKTWQASHNGQAQHVRDVGLYRALEGAASPGSASNLWSSISTQASSGHEAASQALQQLSLWPSRSRVETVSSVASSAPESPRARAASILPPPPPPASALLPLPTLEAPAAAQRAMAQEAPPYLRVPVAAYEAPPYLRAPEGLRLATAQARPLPTLLTCKRFDFRVR